MLRVASVSCDCWWPTSSTPDGIRQTWRKAAADLFFQRLRLSAPRACVQAAALADPSPDQLKAAADAAFDACGPDDVFLLHIVACCDANGDLLFGQGSKLTTARLELMLQALRDRAETGLRTLAVVDAGHRPPVRAGAGLCQAADGDAATPSPTKPTAPTAAKPAAALLIDGSVLHRCAAWGRGALSASVCTDICALLQRGGCGAVSKSFADVAGHYSSGSGGSGGSGAPDEPAAADSDSDDGSSEAHPRPKPGRPAPPTPPGHVAVTLGLLAPLHTTASAEAAVPAESKKAASREGRQWAGNGSARQLVSALVTSVRKVLGGDGDSSYALQLAVAAEPHWRAELRTAEMSGKVAEAIRQARTAGALSVEKQTAVGDDGTAVMDFSTVMRPRLAARGLPTAQLNLLTPQAGGASSVPVLRLGDHYPLGLPPLRQRLRVVLAVRCSDLHVLALAAAEGRLHGMASDLDDGGLQTGYPCPVRMFPCAAHRDVHRPHPELRVTKGGLYRCWSQWSCVQDAQAAPTQASAPVPPKPPPRRAATSPPRKTASPPKSPGSPPATARPVWGGVAAAFSSAPNCMLEANWCTRTTAVGFAHDHPDRNRRRLIPLYDSRGDPHLKRFNHTRRRRGPPSPSRRPAPSPHQRGPDGRRVPAAPRTEKRMVAPLQIRCPQQVVDLKAVFIRHADVTAEVLRQCSVCGEDLVLPMPRITVAAEGSAGFDCFRLVHTTARAVSAGVSHALATSAPPLAGEDLAARLDAVASRRRDGMWEVDWAAFLVLCTLTGKAGAAMQRFRQRLDERRKVDRPESVDELKQLITDLVAPRRGSVDSSWRISGSCFSLAEAFYHPALVPLSAATLFLCAQPAEVQVCILRAQGSDSATDTARAARMRHVCLRTPSPRPWAVPQRLRKEEAVAAVPAPPPEQDLGIKKLGPFSMRPVDAKVTVMSTPRGSAMIADRFAIDIPGELAMLRAWGVGCIGRLSHFSKCTLPMNARRRAHIPLDAATFTWAYPIIPANLCRVTAKLREEHATLRTEIDFMINGGFVYFNEGGRVVGINALEAISMGEPDLAFGVPQPLPPECVEKLQRFDRPSGFQPVTVPGLRAAGIHYFVWIRPKEELGEGSALRWPHGAFAYLGRHPREPASPLDCYVSVRARGAPQPAVESPRQQSPAPLSP